MQEVQIWREGWPEHRRAVYRLDWHAYCLMDCTHPAQNVYVPFIGTYVTGPLMPATTTSQ
jgi:hypothetical protein